jgi:protein-disulfide isomerase
LTVAIVGTTIFSWTHIHSFVPDYNASVIRRASMDQLVPEGTPTIGDREADLTLVYFGDFTCPACRKTLPEMAVLAQRPASGFQLAFRHFPVHQGASDLGILAVLAHARGRFWDFASMVSQLAPGPLDHARLASLTQFLSPVPTRDQSAIALEFVSRDLRDARRFGFTTTPTIVAVRKGSLPLVMSAAEAISVASTRR